jgi:hypothetical protein
MTSRLVQVNIKATDHELVGRFWAAVLGWDVSSEGPGVTNVEPREFPIPDPRALGIDVVAVPDAETVDYRAHLELATASLAHRDELITRLAALGAIEAGQSFADPEGNQFIVREPSDETTGPIAAVVVECRDPRAMAAFWGEASGFAVLGETDERARLRSPEGVGPYLEFVHGRTHPTRMHLDLRPRRGDDHGLEVDRILRLGATRADIGQGDVPWVVLSDVEGNEFCVLTPG